MTMNPSVPMSKHPGSDRLAAFALGKAGMRESAEIEAHLLECTDCQAIVEEAPADPLLALFQSAVQRNANAATPPGPDDQTQYARSGPASYPFLRPPEAPDELGRLGAYRVLQLIGSGGMGLVFLAEDPKLRRKAALKVLKPFLAAEPSFRSRFLREAQAMAAVEHDHICTIFHVGDDDGIPHLAMPLLQGETLAQRIKREGKLPVAEALRIAHETALGLQAAHQRGVIHRDIKPGNIWLEDRGQGSGVRNQGSELAGHGTAAEASAAALAQNMPPASSLTPDSCPLTPGRVKILDFGLAQSVEDESRPSQLGVVAGTPAYMAPEQYSGEPADARVDLFSLGCVLYEMLTGRVPFAATRDPKPIREANPEVPVRAAALVTRLLAREPSDRPPTAQAVVDELAAIRAGEAARPIRRQRLKLALAAGVAVLALGSWIFYWAANYLPRRDAPPVQGPGPPPPVLDPRRNDPIAELSRFTGHGHPFVEGVAFAPDGRRALSCGTDKSIRIWDRQTGTELQVLEGHGATVFRAAFLPDGRHMLSCSGDRTLKLWDTQSGKVVRSFVGHADEVHDVVLSSDGKRALSASYDGTLRFWDVQAGSELKVLRGHTSVVFKAALSSDGKQALSASSDGTVRLWDVDSERELKRFDGHGQRVWCVAFAPDGRTAASSSDDQSIRIWNLESGQEVRRLEGHGEWVRSVAFLPGGKHLVSGGHQREIILWDIGSGAGTLLFSGAKGAVDLAVAPDGRHVLSAGNDGTARLWRMPPPDFPLLPLTAEQARRLQKEQAERLGVPVRTKNTLGMELALIPPGVVMLGPRCQVRVTKPFYLGLHEVTNAQFQAFVDDTKYLTDVESSGRGGIAETEPVKQRADYTWKNLIYRGGDQHPVGQLSWSDADRFCRWLSAKEKKTYRLPTEAEWEWACRAGTLTPFYFGPDRADLDDHAWSKSNSRLRSQPVGKLRPNAWGLHDTIGNVVEHCRDWLAEYPAGAHTDYAGPPTGDRRVVRGGGFYDAEIDTNTRGSFYTDQSFHHFGFRVLREP